MQLVQDRLTLVDLGRRSGLAKAGDGEVAAAVVNLDQPLAVAAAFGNPALEEDLDAAAAGRDLGVRVEAADDLGGPVRQPAALRIAAVVEVDAAVRVGRGEDEADAGRLELGHAGEGGVEADVPE